MLHTPRVGHGAHGYRHWILAEKGDGYRSLGYAKRVGFRRWVWQNRRGVTLGEARSLKTVSRLAWRSLEADEEVL